MASICVQKGPLEAFAINSATNSSMNRIERIRLFSQNGKNSILGENFARKSLRQPVWLK